MLGIWLAINGVTERPMTTDKPNHYGVLLWVAIWDCYEFQVEIALLRIVSWDCYELQVKSMDWLDWSE